MSFAGNPRAPQGGTIDESTGPVASDSLAAESLRSGGDFADGNAQPLSVKGANSTLNTTDTSGATALAPADDGTERARKEAMGLGSDEKGVTGVKYPEAAGNPEFSGTHTAEGYTGGPSSDSTGGYNTTSGGTHTGATGDSFADGGAGMTSSSGPDSKISSKGFPDSSSGSGSTGSTSYSSGGTTSGGSGGPSAGTGVRPATDTAPNYAATVSGAIRNEEDLKPKGTNLQEGGIPETKTFTGNVGGQYDPGRAAETTFDKLNADDTISSGAPKYAGDGSQSTENKFDVLDAERVPNTSMPDRQ